MTIQDHDDVQQEFHEILKEGEEFKRVAPWIWLLSFGVTVGLLFGLVAVSTWIFGEQNAVVVAIVVCTAFIGTTIAVREQYLLQRVKRIEMHALTVHNEVLRTGGQIDEAIRTLRRVTPRDPESLQRAAAVSLLADQLGGPRDSKRDQPENR